jgi:hypothetical protein
VARIDSGQVIATLDDGTVVRPDQMPFDQLLASAQSVTALDLPVGAELVEPDVLVKVGFIITAIHLNEGDFGDFLSIECMMRPDVPGTVGRIVVFNDGSTGVFRQLTETDGGIEKVKKALPLAVPNGLRASSYDLVQCVDGHKQPRKSKKSVTPCRFVNAKGEKCKHSIAPDAAKVGDQATYYLDTSVR